MGPRFVLEAAFLIALAIGVGVAELSATAIVAVMAERPRFPAARRTVVAEEQEEPDEVTPPETVEPAAITEIREPESAPRRLRFWRRRGAVSGGGA